MGQGVKGGTVWGLRLGDCPRMRGQRADGLAPRVPLLGSRPSRAFIPAVVACVGGGGEDIARLSVGDTRARMGTLVWRGRADAEADASSRAAGIREERDLRFLSPKNGFRATE